VTGVQTCALPIYFHEGMLHVLDVPNFKYILIHIGNTDDDTAGCLLVGSAIGQDQKSIVSSTVKYKEVYKLISMALLNSEPVTITYKKVYE